MQPVIVYCLARLLYTCMMQGFSHERKVACLQITTCWLPAKSIRPQCVQDNCHYCDHTWLDPTFFESAVILNGECLTSVDQYAQSECNFIVVTLYHTKYNLPVHAVAYHHIMADVCWYWIQLNNTIAIKISVCVHVHVCVCHGVCVCVCVCSSRALQNYTRLRWALCVLVVDSGRAT